MFDHNIAMQHMLMHEMVWHQQENMRSLSRMMDLENQRMIRQNAAQARHMEEMEILRQIYEDEDNRKYRK
jgi:hypothetical protein